MKQLRVVARKPEMAQSSLATKMNFLVQLTDRAVTFVFQTFGTGGIL